MSEHKKNVLTEKDLAQAAGGSVELSFGQCHFTWTGKEEYRNNNTERWVECASRASSCTFCYCQGQNWCVDRWHMITLVSGKLAYEDRANHGDKKRDNNYNTVN